MNDHTPMLLNEPFPSRPLSRAKSVASAEQGVQRARAEWAYANNNLNRIRPLLAKQFVTVDQVDKAQSSETALAEALKQAESQVQLSQAGLRSALAFRRAISGTSARPESPSGTVGLCASDFS